MACPVGQGLGRPTRGTGDAVECDFGRETCSDKTREKGERRKAQKVTSVRQGTGCCSLQKCRSDTPKDLVRRGERTRARDHPSRLTHNSCRRRVLGETGMHLFNDSQFLSYFGLGGCSMAHWSEEVRREQGMQCTS